MQGVIIWFVWHFDSYIVTLLVMSDYRNIRRIVTTQHPLDFVLWQGARSAESVAYGFICEDSSIAATQLEGKRRGVLSSYVESKGCGMRRMSMSDIGLKRWAL